MAILGALVSLIGAAGYAAFDECRAWYRASQYRPGVKLPKNQELEYELIHTFEENWKHDGASLYPKKLIPFLARNDSVRSEYVRSIVSQIIASKGFAQSDRGPLSYHFANTIGDEDAPYGLGAGRYYSECKGTKTGKMIYGPAYYEYDVVRQLYPDEWAVYEADYKVRAAEEKEHVEKEAKTDRTLLWTGTLSIIAVIFLAFALVGPVGYVIGIKPYVAIFLTALFGAFVPFAIMMRRRCIFLPLKAWIVIAIGIVFLIVFFVK